MSTASLRRDHDLIEKVIKSMETTIQLLTNGKQIPESILLPVIDFTKNFTDVCHHSKEEKSLFPALEQAGLPSNMGPVAMMLMDHQRSREIGTEMEESAKKYLAVGDSPHDKTIPEENAAALGVLGSALFNFWESVAKY